METLIGAFVGAVLLQHWLQTRRERREREQLLIERYLLQLQNACESMYYRLVNVNRRGGRYFMSDAYYAISTLYTLASVLALKQVLLLDGIYARLKSFKGLRSSPKNHLYNFDRQLDDAEFLHYHRLALAEALFEREEGYSRLSTYLEFDARYRDDASIRRATGPATEFVSRLNRVRIDPLLNHLLLLIRELEQATDLPSTIR